MSIQEITWNSPWYLHGGWLVLLIFIMVVLLLMTMHHDENDQQMNIEVPLIYLFTLGCYLWLGIFLYHYQPPKVDQWIETKVNPYIETLPTIQADEISFKAKTRFQDNTFEAEIGLPDPYGFPINETMYAKVIRDEKATASYLTYKILEHDLGKGMDAGRYDIKVHMTETDYTNLTKQTDFRTQDGVYKKGKDLRQFLMLIFYTIGGFATLLAIYVVVIYFDNRRFSEPPPVPNDRVIRSQWEDSEDQEDINGTIASNKRKIH